MDGNVAMYEIKLRTECILICINNRGGLNEKLTASHEASDILLINFLPVFLGHIRRIKPDKEETRGFRSGNVEVFPSSDDGGRPSSSGAGRYQQDGARQQAVEVEIINAKRKIRTTDRQFEDDVDIVSSADIFASAWKGGPASAGSSTFTTNSGRSGEARTHRTDTAEENGSMNNAAQRRARELLATNPEILNILMRAQSNGILRKAVHDCMGNPKSFGRYWDDPIVGPILNELKGCI